MAVQHANRGIVKKDLQLYYNREWAKSFRGEATSNLIMNPSDANYYQGLYNFTVTPNAETAPDGTNNAWSLAWNGTAFNYYSKNFPIVNSTVYTTSVFAKAGTHNVIWIGVSSMSGGENNASFNLTTGVATNGSPASTSCSMVYYGNGWWRCITTNTSGTSGATTSAMTVSVGANRATLGTVYLWGFQAERKSYATTFLDSLNPIRNQVATNLYSPYAYDGYWFINTYNYQGSTGATISVVSGIDNPINSSTVLRYFTGTTGYQYFALSKAGLASGTYTVSYYARLESGSPTGLGNTQLWRDGGTDLGVLGDWNPTFYTYWRRFRTTASVTSGTLHFFPIHGGSIAGGSVVYYTGFQLESGNEPTSFTPSSVTTANTVAAGGGLLDISGNGLHTTLQVMTFDTTGFTFNGSTAYLSVPKLLYVPMTISGYAKYTDQAKALNTFMNGQPHNTLAISLNRNGAGNLVVFIGNGSTWTGTPSITSSSAVTVNVWYNITFTCDGTISTLYLNGVVVGTSPHIPSGFGSGNFFIGHLTDSVSSSEYFKGNISSFQVYGRSLTAAEVLQNFTATRKTYGI
jgi:hypothetical protein